MAGTEQNRVNFEALSLRERARYERLGYLVDYMKDQLQLEWEQQGGEVMRYNELLQTDPKSLVLKTENFFREAALGLKLHLRTNFAISLLSKLQAICLRDRVTEFVISNRPVQPSAISDMQNVRERFSLHPDLFELADHDGVEDGIGIVLQILRGQRPLGRWPRALVSAFDIMPLSPLEGGEGLVGYMETGIDGITLKSHYLPGFENPNLSLLVAPVGGTTSFQPQLF